MNGQTQDEIIDPSIRSRIIGKLNSIEEIEGVRILLAVESGSRAWGFPSPDSDYDVRFIYARPTDWYLSIKPGRDVIELPIDGDLDINGWDIQKALKLSLKPNPVLLEWLSSPIHYVWDNEICGHLRDFSKRIAHNRACVHHYVSLGEGVFARHIAKREIISLKKYFYVLRPAMALRWVRMHPDNIPPMNFQEMTSGVGLPTDLKTVIEDLLAKKASTKEMGEADRVGEIDSFVISEFELAKEIVNNAPKQEQDFLAEADQLFREIVTTRNSN